MRARGIRLTAVVSLVALATLAAPPRDAAAHGGQYRSPAAPPEEEEPRGGRGAGVSPEDWTDWWWANRDRYVELARRLRKKRLEESVTAASGGGLGSTGATDASAAPPEAAPEVPADAASALETVILPALLAALRDPDGEVRSAAAVALGKTSSPRAHPSLRLALRDGHPDVRDGAVLSLGMLRDDFALDEFRAILLDPAVRERSRGFAALAAGICGGEGGAALLLRFLDPSSDALRTGGIGKTADLEACAVLGLGLAGSRTAVEPLRRILASGNERPPVRASACTALARLGDRDSIPMLLRAASHRESPLRQSAVLALGVLATPDDREVVETLLGRLAEDRDGAARQFCIASLGRIGAPAALPYLRRALAEGDVSERPFAALALATAGDRASEPAIRAVLGAPGNPGHRGAAAVALGILADAKSLPDLRALAFSKADAALRIHAFTGLALQADEESAPALRRALEEEPEPRLRLAAAVALAILQDAGARPALERLAEKGESTAVRANAAYFLGVAGGPPAAPTLARLLADTRQPVLVRTFAAAGLGVLADRSPLPVLSSLGADGNFRVAVDPMMEVATFL